MSTPPTAPQVHATGLGHAEIRVGESMITPISDRLFALTFHLCVRAGEYIPRDELVALFWGDREPTKGRHSLRQMLYRLRQMGVPLVDAGDAVHLPDAAVACDVRAVLREGWERDATGDEVRAGSEQIAGGPQAYTEAYRDWYDALEARVRTQLRRAALQLLGAAKREGRWGAVEEWALHVLRHDALNEEATLALAESMVMTGSKVRALEVLDGYLAELGDRADRIGLPAKVLRKRITAASATQTTEQESPIFGREAETQILTEMLTATASGQPRSCLLHGPAGIGKTRLLTETLSIAALQGFSVVPLMRYPAGSDRQPASDFTTELCKAVEQLPGAAAADPLAMSTVRRTIRGSVSALSPLAGGTAHTQSDTFASIAALLTASADDRPVCVIVDDTHRLAESERRDLQGAIVATSLARVCWLLAARTDAFSQCEDLTHVLHPVAVDPLAPIATDALAKAFCERTGVVCDAKRLANLRSIAGGNPLLLQTLILSHSASPVAGTQESLERALAHYLSGLPQASIQFLEAVAFLQPHATVARVTKACATTPRIALPALSALTRCGILSDDPEHPLQLHDAWSAILRSQRTSTELAALALCCAQVLSDESAYISDHTTHLHGAHLFCLAGETASAHQAFRRAAALAACRGQYSAALSILSEAHQISEGSPASTHLLPDLALYAYLSGHLEKAIEYASAIASSSLASEELSADDILTSAAIHTDSLWKLNRPFSHHLTSLCALLTQGGTATTAFLTAALYALRLALVERTLTTARSVISLVDTHRLQHGDSVLAALCSVIFSTETGQTDDMLDAIDRADALTDRFLPVHIQALSIRYRLIANRYLGRLDIVENLALEGISLAVGSGLPSEAFQISISAGFAFLDEESGERSSYWFSQARAYASSFASAERERALLYGLARLDLLRGDYNSGLAKYNFLLGNSQPDFMPRRQALELALCSYCLAQAGALEKARQLASTAEAIVLSTSSSQQLDAAAEHLLGTFELTATLDVFEKFGSSYLSIRDYRGQRHIPSGFRRLKTVANAFYAASSTPALRSTTP